MPISKNTLDSKLAKIREFIRRIEDMDFTQEEYDEDLDIQDAMTFRLAEAVEQSIHIGTHLVSALELPRPETHKEIFLLLGKKKYLSNEVAQAMSKAVGFRNLAFHEYGEDSFDIKQVYRDYKDDVRDLKKFCVEVVELLEKSN